MLKSMKKCPMFPQQHGSNWFFLPSCSPSTGESYMLPNDQLVLLESVASLSLTKASTRSSSRMMFTDCPKSPEDSIWGQLLRGFFSLSRVCKSHSPLCALYLSCEEPLSPKHGFTCSIMPESIILFFHMALWKTKYWFSFREVYCLFLYILATFCSITF